MNAATRRSTLDLAAVFMAGTAIWWFLIPSILDGDSSAATLIIVFVSLLVHVAWISPRLIHNDPRVRHGFGSIRSFGVRTDIARESFRFYTIATLGGTAALLVWGWTSGPVGAGPVRWSSVAFKAVSYLPSAAVQVLIFFEFFLVRFDDVFKTRASAPAAAALVFAGFHLPNMPLAVVTLIAGFVWAGEYQRRPHFLPLVLSHTILGTVATQLAHISNRSGPFVFYTGRYLIRDLIPWWGAFADQFLPRILIK